MEIMDKFEILKKSKIHKDWHKKNQKSYLAHIFRMFDEANKNIWQFGFYNSDDTITTFIMEDNDIKEVPEQEIFKSDKHQLKKLDLKKIKFDFGEALDIGEKLRKDKYKQHPVLKTFVILQLLDTQIYNVTFVTQTFSTLNIHIDSQSKKIISEKLTSLLELGKFEKGEADYIG